MSKPKQKRRSPGEGTVFEYQLKNGTTRFGIKFTVLADDGKRKPVLRRRDSNGEPWTRKGDAAKALREALGKAENGTWVDPSKMPFGDFLDEWVEGLDSLGDSTVEGYRKNIRLHVKPMLGAVPLASLTTNRLTKFYKDLRASGRKDHRGGEALSARSVRLIHVMIRRALQTAVDAKPPLLAHNPADEAGAPTAKQAKAPEMWPWTHDQLRAFLAWSAGNSELHTAWTVAAMTGVRRGELLALRWRDVNFDERTLSVRRSVVLVKRKGQGERKVEKPTKTEKPRVIDLDDDTVALLRAYRRERAGLALQLGRSDALVFGDAEGEHLHPERFSRSFKAAVKRCGKALATQRVEPPPSIRLHDLRHTHATIFLGDLKVNPTTVSERLGHADVTTTLGIYAHALPAFQRDAVDRFAALVGGVSGA